MDRSGSTGDGLADDGRWMPMPRRRTAVRCGCAPSRACRSRLRSSSASLPVPIGRSCRTLPGACPAAACGSTRRARPWPRRCAARSSPAASSRTSRCRPTCPTWSSGCCASGWPRRSASPTRRGCWLRALPRWTSRSRRGGPSPSSTRPTPRPTESANSIANSRPLGGLEGAPAAIIRELAGGELSLAIGRPNVIHAAAAEGGASRRLIEEARRLGRYRLGPAQTVACCRRA